MELKIFVVVAESLSLHKAVKAPAELTVSGLSETLKR